jgi:hypothetical protein
MKIDFELEATISLLGSVIAMIKQFDGIYVLI